MATLRHHESRIVRAPVVRAVGNGRHVELQLSDAAPFHDLERGLHAFLDLTNGRFAGGQVVINMGRHALSPDRVAGIRRLLEEQYQLTVAKVVSGSELAPDSRAEQPPSALQARLPEGDGVADDASRDTLLVRGTCRSGTSLYNDGNIVILGDVNPGAEVTATGDIVVMGRLRGQAHAGAGGSEAAHIVAFAIEAATFRIGPYVGQRTLPRATRHTASAETALVRLGSIVIEPHLPKSGRR